jgi:hypothetical protein
MRSPSLLTVKTSEDLCSLVKVSKGRAPHVRLLRTSDRVIA